MTTRPSSTSSSSSSSSNVDAQLAKGAEHLYTRTPLLHSAPLSDLVGKPVYLKMDAFQASGSFKDRGMSHLCATYYHEGTQELVSSSGGNAGLAVATVGEKLGMPVSVIVPDTTKLVVLAKLRSLGATVTVHGHNWNAADTYARALVDDDHNHSEQPHQQRCQYVSPYDNPLLWTGHSTLVDELCEQLRVAQQSQQETEKELPKLATIIVSVGGGGLLCGVLEGCTRRQIHTTTHILTCETEGAACFQQSYTQKHCITLPGIDSIATSLGATSCTPVAVDRATAYPGGVTAGTCTDTEAIEACVQFARDHRVLVEPACGAALAMVYSPRLRQQYLTTTTSTDDDDDRPIVIEVCGGSGVDLDLLHGWKTEYLTSSS